MATRFEQIKQDIKDKANKQSEKTRREYKEFFDHPLLYIALVASGFLSALAGVAIGLGVKMVDGNMKMTVDVGHIFFALIYSILFPYFFEFGLGNWLHKLLHREPENKWQLWTASVMVAVTFIGTAITAYSAMDVLVTAGGFFAAFTEIPASIQRWIAFALPTMFLLNIASGEFYRQFTTEAILKRAANVELRENQIAADMEVELAKMKAKKDIAIATANEYASKAEKDAPEIGKNRGSEKWNNDKATYQPAMHVMANETKLDPTPAGSKQEQPPR